MVKLLHTSSRTAAEAVGSFAITKTFVMLAVADDILSCPNPQDEGNQAPSRRTCKLLLRVTSPDASALKMVETMH